MVSILLLISAFTVVIHLMLPINPVIPVVLIPPLMLLAEAAGLNPALNIRCGSILMEYPSFGKDPCPDIDIDCENRAF